MDKLKRSNSETIRKDSHENINSLIENAHDKSLEENKDTNIEESSSKDNVNSESNVADEPTSPSKKGQVFVIDFNDGNTSPKKTPKRFQVTKTKKKRYYFDDKDENIVEKKDEDSNDNVPEKEARGNDESNPTQVQEIKSEFDNVSKDKQNTLPGDEHTDTNEQKDEYEQNELLNDISESSIELPKLKAINSPRPFKRDHKIINPNDSEKDIINRRNDTYIRDKEMLEYKINNLKDGKRKTKKKGDLIDSDLKDIVDNEKLVENNNDESEKIDRNEKSQRNNSKNVKDFENLGSTFNIKDSIARDQIEGQMNDNELDLEEEINIKQKSTKKGKVKKSKRDSPKEIIETINGEKDLDEKERKQVTKEKKSTKVRQIKEAICDEEEIPDMQQAKYQEECKNNQIPETPAKSIKKVKNSRSPMKTKLPMLEQRRRRVMNKLIEIDATGGCTSHRPSLANNDCDDVIFITEDMYNSGQTSHSSMAIMSSESSASPPLSSPREVPYSALSEPGPTLFEDMFEYGGKKSSSRKHRRHRTASASRAKVLLDNDAIESCDSGISLSDNGR